MKNSTSKKGIITWHIKRRIINFFKTVHVNIFHVIPWKIQKILTASFVFFLASSSEIPFLFILFGFPVLGLMYLLCITHSKEPSDNFLTESRTAARV